MTASGSEYEDGLQSSIDDVDVKSLVLNLFRYIRKKKEYEINMIYDRLSDSMFKDTRWPSVSDVDQYVDDNHINCLLYREMWFRHLNDLTLGQRICCCDNYLRLFTLLYPGMLHIHLSNQWLWDMVDEFVNQFQSYWLYRGDLEIKTEQCMKLLSLNDEAWSVFQVLNLLEKMAENSSVNQILQQEKDGLEPFTATDDIDYVGGTQRMSNVSKVLGYFSKVGLLRVHCLLGNYQTGLNCLLPIDISQQGFYTCVFGSHITTIYHYGFANLMLQRYEEAIREFNKILVYSFKIKQPQQKAPQYERMLKKIEKMYSLLAICLSLCPQVQLIDENVSSQLMQKYGEKMFRMQRYDDGDDDGDYKGLLSYAWPTFETPFAPCSGDPRELYKLDDFDEEDMASAFPAFFTPNAPSYDQALVNHNKLEVVVAHMLKLKQK